METAQTMWADFELGLGSDDAGTGDRFGHEACSRMVSVDVDAPAFALDDTFVPVRWKV